MQQTLKVCKLASMKKLVKYLAEVTSLPITYAGGGRSIEDLELVERLSNGKVDLTIGSALDIFGGKGVAFEACLPMERESGFRSGYVTNPLSFLYPMQIRGPSDGRKRCRNRCTGAIVYLSKHITLGSGPTYVLCLSDSVRLTARPNNARPLDMFNRGWLRSLDLRFVAHRYTIGLWRVSKGRKFNKNHILLVHHAQSLRLLCQWTNQIVNSRTRLPWKNAFG